MKRAVKSSILIAAAIAVFLCFPKRTAAKVLELRDTELSEEELSEEGLSEEELSEEDLLEDSQEDIDALVEQYLQEMELENIPGGKQEFNKITDPEISVELTSEGKLLNRFPNQGYFISTAPNGMFSSQPVELSLSSGCVAIIEHDGISSTLTSSRRFAEAGSYHIRILSYQTPEEALQSQDYDLYETNFYFTVLDTKTSRIGAIPAPEGLQIYRVTQDGKELPVENPRCFFLTGDGHYTIQYTWAENSTIVLPDTSWPAVENPEAVPQNTIPWETSFTCDTTAPFLSFSQELENGENASGMLEFYPSEENCQIYLSYNGEQGYAVSNQLTVAGYYHLQIQDSAGNRREYHLRIRPNYRLFDKRIVFAGIILLIAVGMWMLAQRRNMQVL